MRQSFQGMGRVALVCCNPTITAKRSHPPAVPLFWGPSATGYCGDVPEALLPVQQLHQLPAHAHHADVCVPGREGACTRGRGPGGKES